MLLVGKNDENGKKAKKIVTKALKYGIIIQIFLKQNPIERK